jgi:hypothetical protein
VLGEHVETVVEFYERNFYFPWEIGLAADLCEIKELLVEIVILSVCPVVLDTYSADSPLSSCAVGCDGVILVGDETGQLPFLIIPAGLANCKDNFMV